MLLNTLRVSAGRVAASQALRTRAASAILATTPADRPAPTPLAVQPIMLMPTGAPSGPGASIIMRHYSSKKKAGGKGGKGGKDDNAPEVRIEDVIASTVTPSKQKISRTIEVFRTDLAQMRMGVANPAILESVTVDVKGMSMSLRNLCQVSVLNPQTLQLNVFDASMSEPIAEAIRGGGMGLNPSTEGNIIKVPVPRVTKEYRESLVKQIEKDSEHSKISIRNIRQAALRDLKKVESSLPKDSVKRVEKDIQKVIDDGIKEIDSMATQKTKALLNMEVRDK
ncbi:hypothetical protein H696_05255 [Fonticula alba]|uniref:Ribosome recycling factor domain-containing protein n=1 Tax=Fonticula alba TaxID=691883 RepID=A0A058Z329_FONAL|nr:hypothetical protein H696_05255 [Fonticula alba]KCV68338.1 hypothetical protein H696_05255 [Fonticula alba]|eukprot:XP_009497392.1 hypothetical protein H696_05255 [Fonticula alba]